MLFLHLIFIYMLAIFFVDMFFECMVSSVYGSYNINQGYPVNQGYYPVQYPAQQYAGQYPQYPANYGVQQPVMYPQPAMYTAYPAAPNMVRSPQNDTFQKTTSVIQAAPLNQSVNTNAKQIRQN